MRETENIQNLLTLSIPYTVLLARERTEFWKANTKYNHHQIVQKVIKKTTLKSNPNKEKQRYEWKNFASEIRQARRQQ